MNKWGCAILSVISFLGVFSSHAETNYYQIMQDKFYQSTLPNISEFENGWYSGRCYVRREVTAIKSGALVLKKNAEQITISIPAMSITEKEAFFDQMDEDKKNTYMEYVFLRKNSPMTVGVGGLISQLYYDILIGDLHLRQSGKSLMLAMTNYQESPLDPQRSYFFCEFKTKVMELTGQE